MQGFDDFEFNKSGWWLNDTQYIYTWLIIRHVDVAYAVVNVAVVQHIAHHVEQLKKTAVVSLFKFDCQLVSHGIWIDAYLGRMISG